MQLTGKSVETVRYFLSKNWKAYIFIGMLAFSIGFFEALSTAALYPVLALASPGTATNTGNKYLDVAIAWATNHVSISPLYTAVSLLIGLTCVKLVLSYFNLIFAWSVSNKLVQKTRVDLISSFLSTDYQYLMAVQKGDLAYRVLNAPGYIGKVINSIPMIAVEMLKILLIIGMLFMISPVITFFLILISFVYFWITNLIARRVSYGTGSGRAQSASKQSIYALNILKGYKSIRLYGVAKYWLSLFSRECRKFYEYALKDMVISGIPTSLMELIAVLIICILVTYSGTSEGGIVAELPVIGVFAFSLLKIMPALRQVSALGMGIMANLPNAEAAYLAIIEANHHKVSSDKSATLKGFNTQIQLKDVTFYYEDSNKPALRNVNVNIRHGEFVGIFGSSGSGKTTLLDLLANLLQPSSGQILIDGKPISLYSSEALSDHIGYVGQEPFLFNDTIRNNVLFGRSGFDDMAVREALKKADVLDFVETLPDGLDFVLADDGMKISGGQRQRLIIARAVLRNPEILLLDEATSALDQKTESNILKVIMRLVREDGKTVVFVTHRKSAIRDADGVIEMQDGRVVGSTETAQTEEQRSIVALKNQG